MTSVVIPGDGGCDVEPDEPDVELSVEGEVRRPCDDRTSGADTWKEAGCNEQKRVTAMTKSTQPQP